MMMNPTIPSRREWLRRTSCGFGSLALTALCAEESNTLAAGQPGNPLAPKKPHAAPKAKRVIFLFMRGGPSQVDTFDYKPELQKRDGQEIKAPKGIPTQRTEGVIFGSPFTWAQHGKSETWVSSAFPHVARHADKLCVLKSMHCDSAVHEQAAIQMHTGTFQQVRPSLGSWVLYGLGTESKDLPGFITINPPNIARGKDYGSAFLPAVYQGTLLSGGGKNEGPIRFIGNPEIPRDVQRAQLDLLGEMNRDLGGRLEHEQRIEGLIESHELAFRMQAAVPGLVDLSKESVKTLALYGLDPANVARYDSFGRQCLLARRFLEAGVRFVQISLGDWDHHNDLKKGLTGLASAADQPIAGLLADLENRGMLDDTLVIWGGEFGRSPIHYPTNTGRDHNGAGFTYWLAGGGVKGGMSYGATDELGWVASENRVHVHDLHATVLHLLGLDHERLTYRYGGRDFRLTDVSGRVVKEILA